VQAAHPLSTELRRDTLLSTAADAVAEAERLQLLLGFKAEAYEFSTEFDPLAPIRIGDVGTLTNPYYGLANGRRFVVLKREAKPTAIPPTLKLTLWRVASYGVATPAGVATASVTLDVKMRVTPAGSSGVTAICSIL
jgi:hypothetical protein